MVVQPRSNAPEAMISTKGQRGYYSTRYSCEVTGASAVIAAAAANGSETLLKQECPQEKDVDEAVQGEALQSWEKFVATGVPIIFKKFEVGVLLEEVLHAWDVAEEKLRGNGARIECCEAPDGTMTLLIVDCASEAHEATAMGVHEELRDFFVLHGLRDLVHGIGSARLEYGRTAAEGDASTKPSLPLSEEAYEDNFKRPSVIIEVCNCQHLGPHTKEGTACYKVVNTFHHGTRPGSPKYVVLVDIDLAKDKLDPGNATMLAVLCEYGEGIIQVVRLCKSKKTRKTDDILHLQQCQVKLTNGKSFPNVQDFIDKDGILEFQPLSLSSSSSFSSGAGGGGGGGGGGVTASLKFRLSSLLGLGVTSLSTAQGYLADKTDVRSKKAFAAINDALALGGALAGKGGQDMVVEVPLERAWLAYMDCVDDAVRGKLTCS